MLTLLQAIVGHPLFSCQNKINQILFIRPVLVNATWQQPSGMIVKITSMLHKTIGVASQGQMSRK